MTVLDTVRGCFSSGMVIEGRFMFKRNLCDLWHLVGNPVNMLMAVLL